MRYTNYTNPKKNKGIAYVSGLTEGRTNPETLIKMFWNNKRNHGIKIALFSDPINYENGVKIAKYIKDHKLGDIIQGKENLNTNSNNVIQTWMWCIYKKRMDEWHNEQK